VALCVELRSAKWRVHRVALYAWIFLGWRLTARSVAYCDCFIDQRLDYFGLVL
jgi:hypothetical protein